MRNPKEPVFVYSCWRRIEDADVRVAFDEGDSQVEYQDAGLAFVFPEKTIGELSLFHSWLCLIMPGFCTSIPPLVFDPCDAEHRDHVACHFLKGEPLTDFVLRENIIIAKPHCFVENGGMSRFSRKRRSD